MILLKLIVTIAFTLCLKATLAQYTLPAVIDLRNKVYSTQNIHQLNDLYRQLLAYEHNYPLDSLDVYSGRALSIARALKDENAELNAILKRFNFFSLISLHDSTNAYRTILQNRPENKVYDSSSLEIQLAFLRDDKLNSRINETIKGVYDLQRHYPDYRYLKLYSAYYLGGAFGSKGQYEESMQMYDFINTYHGLVDSIIYARVLNNVAVTALHLAETTHNDIYIDSGINSNRRSLQVALETGNLYMISQARVLRGYINIYKGNLDSAEKDILFGINLDRQTKNINYLASGLTVYATYCAVAKKMGKGIAACNEAVHLVKKYSLNNQLLVLAQFALSQNYEAANDQKNYSAALRRLLFLKDSLYYKTTNTELERLQAVYDLQATKLEVVEKEATIKRNRIISIAAILATLLIFISALLILWQFRKRQRAELKLLEERESRRLEHELAAAKEKERKRIAADLHDNLGVRANAILHNASRLGEPGQDLSLIHDNLQGMARDMLSNLRDTLWVMNLNHVTGKDISLRLKNFVQLMNRQFPNANITITGNGAPRSFSNNAAMDILMIMQEAVNNAIKHSNSPSIEIREQLQNGQWILSVTDHGAGFGEDAHNKTYSYGLIGMQERAKKNGFLLNVDSQKGIGTVVQLIVPDN